MDSALAEPGLSGRSVSSTRRPTGDAIVAGGFVGADRSGSVTGPFWAVSGLACNRRLTDRAHNILDLMDGVGVERNKRPSPMSQPGDGFPVAPDELRGVYER
jgi:hypothetical protein